MSSHNDLIGFIKDLIRDETRFLKHYRCQVLNDVDPYQKGQIQVSIPALNITTQEDGIWVSMRDNQSINIPIKDDWVDVYFMDGHPDRPVCLGKCLEIDNQTPYNFDGQRSTHVIFENPKESGEYIKYDELTKKLSVIINEIIFNDGDEHFVLGDTLKTELKKVKDQLEQLSSDFSMWNPTGSAAGFYCADGILLKTQISTGFSLKPPADFSMILSTTIKGK